MLLEIIACFLSYHQYEGKLAQFLPMRYKRNCAGGILEVCLRTIAKRKNFLF